MQSDEHMLKQSYNIGDCGC